MEKTDQEQSEELDNQMVHDILASIGHGRGLEATRARRAARHLRKSGQEQTASADKVTPEQSATERAGEFLSNLDAVLAENVQLVTH